MNSLTNDELVHVYNALDSEISELKELADGFFRWDRMGAYYSHRRWINELKATKKKVGKMIDWEAHNCTQR